MELSRGQKKDSGIKMNCVSDFHHFFRSLAATPSSRLRRLSPRSFWHTGVVVLAIAQGYSEVVTYDIPGGTAYRSPDYDITVEQGGVQKSIFVHHTIGLNQYSRYDSVTGQLVQTYTFNHLAPARLSDAIFSFSGTVTVKITVKTGAKHIILPLQSAKVLPSSYNIPCTIENGNTIILTLNRPEKVTVIPNYNEAMAIYTQKGIGHVPIATWNVNYSQEKLRPSYHGTQLYTSISEGFMNPLMIAAQPLETRVPKKTASTTLMVNPGDRPTQAQLNNFEVVWFAPGIHDMSYIGVEPFHQIIVKAGQTMYLEGGAFVKGRFQKDLSTGTGAAVVTGRGYISGEAHKWVHDFDNASQIIDIDTLSGIIQTDRRGFGLYAGRYVDNIMMVGAWTYNSDGPDYTDNMLIQNSLFMAFDDNLKINHNTHIRHCVIWQGNNAHAIMVKETWRDGMTFANSLVEDVDIIGYYSDPDSRNYTWSRLAEGAIGVVTGMDLKIQNLTFRDIRIEAPFLFRVLNVHNLNTDSISPTYIINPGWFRVTTEQFHTRIDGIVFQNIQVRCPVIAYESQLSSGYAGSLKNIRIINLDINGTFVTESNKYNYFDIQESMIENMSFVYDPQISIVKKSILRPGVIHLTHTIQTGDLILVIPGFISGAKARVSLYDLNGRRLLSLPILTKETTLPTRNLHKGMCLVKIDAGSGATRIEKWIGR